MCNDDTAASVEMWTWRFPDGCIAQRFGLCVLMSNDTALFETREQCIGECGTNDTARE